MSGTLKKVVLDGESYDVPADINITFKRSNKEKEGIATSGKTMIKITLTAPTIESLGFVVTPAELERLNILADRVTSFPISIELADGSVYKTTGQIMMENYESEEGKASCKIIPDKTRDAWTPFVAD
jgi:hypothetical protein